MAIDSNVAFVNTNGTAFPDNESINASGPTAVDGTEFVKVMIDNYMFGPQQSLLNYAGLIPSGVVEADGASQEIESMQKSFGHPGESIIWYGNNDPAVFGLRALLLQGQGILVANYQDLNAAVYTGDGTNGTAEAFYRADDAAGTIRNTAGAYLILPDARGLAVRGLDDTGLIDVDGGGTRLPGDFQDDEFESHTHDVPVVNSASDGANAIRTSAAAPNAFRTSETAGGTETRMKNISAHLAIRY